MSTVLKVKPEKVEEVLKQLFHEVSELIRHLKEEGNDQINISISRDKVYRIKLSHSTGALHEEA
jgi:hypothetical protein